MGRISRHDIRHKLIDDIERFCSKTGMAKSAFGRSVMDDSGFVFRLQSGIDVRASTYAKCMDYMDGELARRERVAS
jgi:hypothetical protein